MMRTRSPSLKLFASSWARYFFVFLIVFLRTGWMNRRSTRTVTVWSFFDEVTTPCRMRLGMVSGLRAGGLGRLFVQDRLHPRDVAAHEADARGVFHLVRGLLEAEVEGLLLQLHDLIAQLVRRLVSQV